MSLGNNLRRFRKNKNLSQEQVARDLNISRQSISKWENDVCRPDIENITRLSTYYDVPLDSILNKNSYVPSSQKKFEHEDQTFVSNSYTPNPYPPKDEGLNLLAISLICFVLAPLGLIIAPVIFKRNKKENTLYRLVSLTCVLCFLINLFIAFGVVTDLLGLGTTSVELVDLRK
jgi:transcriptional regulator with XRE-family HTH domain